MMVRNAPSDQGRKRLYTFAQGSEEQLSNCRYCGSAKDVPRICLILSTLTVLASFLKFVACRWPLSAISSSLKTEEVQRVCHLLYLMNTVAFPIRAPQRSTTWIATPLGYSRLVQDSRIRGPTNRTFSGCIIPVERLMSSAPPRSSIDEFFLPRSLTHYNRSATRYPDRKKGKKK